MRVVSLAVTIDITERELMVVFAWIDAGVIDAGPGMRLVLLPSALFFSLSRN